MDFSLDPLIESDGDFQDQATHSSSISGKGKYRVKKTSAAPRARNFNKEEIEVLVREAGKCARTLKGRFQPNCTNDIKQKKWMEVSKMVNSINGVGDRTWQNCRKKWHDLMASARGKYRNHIMDSKRTGGGSLTTEPLTKVEQMAIESVGEVTVKGIVGGLDSNDPNESPLYIQRNDLDSEISFDSYVAYNSTSSPSLFTQDRVCSQSPPPLTDLLDQDLSPNTSTHDVLFPIPINPASLKIHNRKLIAPKLKVLPTSLGSPDQPSTSQLSSPILSGVQHTSSPQYLTPSSVVSAAEQKGKTPSPRVPRLPPIQSNRTVTRDLRRQEFKALLKVQEENNNLLKQLIRFKRNKALFEYGVDFLEDN